MEKIEQIRNAMKIVDKQMTLKGRSCVVFTKTERETAMSEYRALGNKLLSEYDRDVNGLAYCERNRREYGNELLDIEEDCDVEELIGIFKIANITKFTVSVSDTSLMTTLALLDKKGYKPIGMTRINTRYIDFEGNAEKADAIIMKTK